MVKIPDSFDMQQAERLRVPQGGEMPLAPQGSFSRNARIAGMVGETVGKAGNLMIQVLQKEKEFNDKSWAREALQGYITESDKRLNETINGTKGKSAIGISRKASEHMNERMSEYELKAPTEEARRLFNERAFNIKRTALNQYSNHEASETNKWRVSTAKGELSTHIQSVNSKWKLTEAQTDLYIEQNIKPVVEDLAQLTGSDTTALLQEVQAKIYYNKILMNISAGNTVKARQLFGMYDKKLLADQREPLERAMHQREVDNEATAIAQDLSDKIKLKEDNMDYNKAFGIINKMENKEVAAVAKQKLKLLDVEVRAFIKSKTEELQNSYAEEYTYGPVVDKTSGTRQALSLYEKFTWVNALPERTEPEKASKAWILKRYAWESKAQGINPRSNPDSYSELVTGIIQGEINTENELQTNEYAAEITRGDLDKLKTMLDKKQNIALARSVFKYFMKQKDWSTEREREFLTYAIPKIQDTNRGEDRPYIENLVRTYLSVGQKDSEAKIKKGEMTVEEAYRQWKDDPESIDINKFTLNVPKEAYTEYEKQFYQYPILAKKWIKYANGDRNLAIRLKYNNDIKMSLGKKTGVE